MKILENKAILRLLIESCKEGKRSSQDELYKAMYSYGMSICLRYTRNREEAHEVLNDGFLKVFANLHKYNFELSYKAWIRRILINSSIDYFRRNEKHAQTLDMVHAEGSAVENDSLERLSAAEIMAVVQQLPPAYRMVFNLYAIEGYKHREIAEMLGINEGTSKSNLAKARHKLQKMLLVMNHDKRENYG